MSGTEERGECGQRGEAEKKRGRVVRKREREGGKQGGRERGGGENEEV